MAIGSYGDFVFVANSNQIKSFDNFNLESESRWSEHEMINVKKRSEFLSDGEKKATLDILLSIDLGVNPADERDILADYKATGAINYLIIGSRVIGKFYIKSMSEEYSKIDGAGVIWEMKLKVTFNEYCEDTYTETKSTSTKNTTSTTTAGTKTLNYDTGTVS